MHVDGPVKKYGGSNVTICNLIKMHLLVATIISFYLQKQLTWYRSFVSSDM